jgi:small subunit ribosomal protein S1
MTTEPAELPETKTAPEAPAAETTAPSAGDSARGPLAAFKRPATDESAASSPPNLAREGVDVESSGAAKAAGEARGPRGKGDRSRRGPRSDQHAAENAEVDRSIAAERKAKQDSGPRPAVPVPNRRHRSEELEAEVAAALGDMSLDDIVAGQAKLSGERLENDSRHRAQVAEVFGDDVFFSLGGKNQGVASVRSFPEPPQPGDMIDVVVRGFNPEDNLYDLAIPGGAIVVGDWSEITEGSLVEAKITGSNTGGLECQVKALRGFIPASQVALYRIENFGDFVGQTLVCVVTESNERRGNLVLSRRAVLEREMVES